MIARHRINIYINVLCQQTNLLPISDKIPTHSACIPNNHTPSTQLPLQSNLAPALHLNTAPYTLSTFLPHNTCETAHSQFPALNQRHANSATPQRSYHSRRRAHTHTAIRRLARISSEQARAAGPCVSRVLPRPAPRVNPIEARPGLQLHPRAPVCLFQLLLRSESSSGISTGDSARTNQAAGSATREPKIERGFSRGDPMLVQCARCMRVLLFFFFFHIGRTVRLFVDWYVFGVSFGGFGGSLDFGSRNDIAEMSVKLHGIEI